MATEYALIEPAELGVYIRRLSEAIRRIRIVQDRAQTMQGILTPLVDASHLIEIVRGDLMKHFQSLNALETAHDD